MPKSYSERIHELSYISEADNHEMMKDKVKAHDQLKKVAADLMSVLIILDRTGSKHSRELQKIQSRLNKLVNLV